METGLITYGANLICATLNLIYAFIFLSRNRYLEKRLKFVIFFEGICAFFWNIGLAGYSISPDSNIAILWFYLVMISFNCYLVAIIFFIRKIIKLSSTEFISLTSIFIILSVLDFLFFTNGPTHLFIRFHSRTAYYIQYHWSVIYHYAYILSFFLTVMPLVLIKAKKIELKRNRLFLLRSVIYNIIMMILAIPDTLLPLFHIPSYPSSGFGVTISFLLMIHLCMHYNTFSISRNNITDYIFNLPRIGILVFDVKWNLSLSNDFAKTLLKLPEITKLNIHRIFEIDDWSIKRIEEDLPVNHHFESINSGIPCSIEAAIAKDEYNSPYCYILMVSDMTYEEQSVMLEKAQERQFQVEKFTLQTVELLAKAIDAKDTYTNGHSERVSEYAVKLAKQIKLNKDLIEEIRLGALLHDIGKIAIPDSILKKPSRLTDNEFFQIKTHTTTGASILKNLKPVPCASIIANFHHERIDGKGYPNGLKEGQIPLEARIVCIADAYDAMNSHRVYRPPLSREQIREELLKGKGTQFDSFLLDNFIFLLDNDLL